jgi:hypothetical protein
MLNLNDFLSRIQTDHTFYLQFRLNPKEVLAPYELSAEERTTLTESRERLWECLGQPNSYWKSSCNYVLLESDELEFDIDEALGLPEVQSNLGEIRSATMDRDRLKSVLALLERIG